MVTIFVSISRLTIIGLFAIYTYLGFFSLRSYLSERQKNSVIHVQTFFMLLILVNANLVIYICKEDITILILMVAEIAYVLIAMLIFKKIYRSASNGLVNNMCMLLTISFIILSRLDMEKAMKQLALACIALLLSILIPFFVHRISILNELRVLYAGIGIIGLGSVLVFGNYVYGAKLNIAIGSVTLQPSEFVKILFVFFIASMLYESCDLEQIVITTVVAMAHVLILVACRDLGSAGIFLVTYLIMVYVATKKIRYLLGGGLLIIVGLFICYQFFSHVQVRVQAWLDPLSDPEDAGYQICQSLFAISTGGWFGSGLCQGMPNKIPVVAQDFVFAAISEEFGAIFALLLILVCLLTLLLIFKVSLSIQNMFYKLIALGLGTIYGVQVFLTIGGTIKFIPSTGVTLPLVSYGGSSLLSTMILLAIVQGLYAIRNDEGRLNGKKKRVRRN